MRRGFLWLVLVTLAATCMVGLEPTALGAAQSHQKLTPALKASAQPWSSKHLHVAATPSCPADDDCTSIPSTSLSSGGAVQVGPTQNLGDNQWVYVNLYDFTPGTDIEVGWCTNTQSLSSGPPLCVSSGYVLSSNPTPMYTTEVLADGTQALSFQVLEIDTSNDPFKGEQPGNSTVTGTFYCNAATPCSVDVIDTGVDGLGDKTANTTNTAVIPITFAVPFSGCGSSAANVATESEYGIEFVLPVSSENACTLSDPTLAFNTAQDGLGAVTALSTGSADVAFTDNPESSNEQQVLTQGNYKLIPIALTANVVGFKAEEEQAQVLYPISGLDLTPTMAAGLLTGIYGTPLAADQVECSPSLGCPSFGGTSCTRKSGVTTCTPAPCPYIPTGEKKGHLTCSLFAELNFEQGFITSQQDEAFVRSDDAGSTGLAFDWLCHAPVVPVNVDIPQSSGAPYQATYSDAETAAQLIEDGFGGTGQPLSSCPSVDQYPPEPLGAKVEYTGYEDPNQQDLKMLSYVSPGDQGGEPDGAFASMNWSEALYYGLQIASLQNGGGAFVQPNAASLDAAANDATTNPDGSLALSYSSKDTAQYPMTSVVYAAVCGDAETSQTATDITNMLNQLLDVTGSSSTAALPNGFVPLTPGLSQTAHADIAKDIVGGASADALQSGCPNPAQASGAPPNSITPTPGPSSTGSGSVPTVSHSGSSAGGSRTIPTPRLGSTPQPGGSVAFSGLNGTHAPTSGSTSTPGAQTSEGHYENLLTLTSSSSRVLLPLALLLGLLALMLGTVFAISPGLRIHARRHGGRVGRGVSGLIRKARAAGSSLFAAGASSVTKPR